MAQFLSPIKEVGHLVAGKLKALPFWVSYVLIALFLAGATAFYVLKYGLRQDIKIGTPAADYHVSPPANNLWFSPSGTLVGTQQSESEVIVSTWTPQGPAPDYLTRQTQTFNLFRLQRDIYYRFSEYTDRRVSGVDRQSLPEAFAVASDGSRIAVLYRGYVHVSDGNYSQFIDTIERGSPDQSDPVSAIGFTDTGLLTLAHTNGKVEFRDPRYISETYVSVTTKLDRPSILKPMGNYMVVVSNVAAVVLDMRSLTQETSPRGFPLSTLDRFSLAVSNEGRLAIGTGGTRIFMTPPAGTGNARIELEAYGTVKAASFYDEERVLVGGEFQDVYLLAQRKTPERIVAAPQGANALAVSPNQIAFASASGVFLVPHTKAVSLGTGGKIALTILGILLCALVGLYRFDWKKRRDLTEAEIEKTLDTEAFRLPSELPPDLIEVCAAGECVLYAGAGLSAQAGFPIWKDFVHGLLRWALENQLVETTEANSFRAEIETGDSDPVADSIISRLKTPEQLSLLNNYLRRVFLKTSSPAAAHLLLKRIKFSAVLTTNFDNLLERVYQTSPKQVYTPKDAELLLTALTKRDYFILKLYGTLDDPDTVMVAPAQYESAITGNRVFSQFMQTLFFSRTLLFIGASLEGIEAYLRGISLPRDTARKHYALVAVSGNAWRAKADLLERRYGIKVLAYTPGSDFAELTGFVRKLSARVAMQPPAPVDFKQGTSKLKRLTLEEIGPFDNLELDFDPQLQILLGDNGVGKSTILKAVALALCGEDAQPYADRLLRAGRAHGKIVLETDNKTTYITQIDRNPQTGEAEITSNTARPLEAEGWLALGFPPLRTTSWVAPKGPDAEIKTKSRPVAEDLLPLVRGDVDPRLDKLKQWLVNLDYLSIKEETGSKAEGNRYGELVERVFGVIATVTEGMTLRFVGVERGTNKIILQTDDGVDTPLEALSQGTISLIGWLGILLQRLYEVFDQDEDPTKRYALILMDEIDAHMHPRWQRTLVNHLKEIFPKAQFIATTHSPLLIRGMPFEQVIRFARDKHGKVIMPTLERDMTLGYTDQLLTSLLFGLPSELDDTTERKKKRYYELFEMPDRTGFEEEYELLKQDLMIRIPPRAATYEEKHGEQLAEAVMLKEFGKKLKQLSPEGGEILLNRAEGLRSGLEGGVKSDPSEV